MSPRSAAARPSRAGRIGSPLAFPVLPPHGRPAFSGGRRSPPTPPSSPPPHRHGYTNRHPNGFWMLFGCPLVTLSMLTDGPFPLIQAHPKEFWMQYDGLWMLSGTTLDVRSEAMAYSHYSVISVPVISTVDLTGTTEAPQSPRDRGM